METGEVFSQKALPSSLPPKKKNEGRILRQEWEIEADFAIVIVYAC